MEFMSMDVFGLSEMMMQTPYCGELLGFPKGHAEGYAVHCGRHELCAAEPLNVFFSF